MFTNKENDKFWSKVDKESNPKGCWIWIGNKLPTGYGLFSFNKQTRYAHRYSYELANGPIPKGLFICHSCDNPACCNPSHLFAGTQSENIQDAVNKGRHKHGAFPGSKNPSSKLTEQDVLDIRSMPGPNRLIAEKYGVSKYTIDEIRTRATWKHI